MPRPSLFRAALAAIATWLTAGLTTVLGVGLTVGLTLGLTTGLLAAQAPDARAAAEVARGVVDADPLLVHLDSITEVVPRRGTIDITGTVTNTTAEQWNRVNLHAFSSQSPITDTPSLASSATLDPTEYVGPRVTVPGTFATVEVLDPGQSATFSLSVPVDLLGIDIETGVYWIGVHALGDGAEPRDDVADGRARTFIPHVEARGESISAAVVLPLRARVWHRPDGSIGSQGRWLRMLSEGGRLDALLDIPDVAGSEDLTWLVDPAVLDAVGRLAVGNPARSLAPDPSVAGQETTEPSPSEPSDTESPETSESPESTPDDEQTRTQRALAEAASSWLEGFRRQTVGRPILALPYGDLDVSAAVRHDPERFAQANDRSQAVMLSLGLPSQLTIAPQDGVLSPEAIGATPPEAILMLSDTAFVVPPATDNSMVRLLGHRVLLTSTGVAAGGPAPTVADDPLAVRQRLLSEAGLRLNAGSSAPVVLAVPRLWSAEDAATLFEAFDTPWLESDTVPALNALSAVGSSARALAYTQEDVDAELSSLDFAVARDATDAAALMEEVLTLQTTVETQVLDEVLTTLSELNRTRPVAAPEAARATERDLLDQLADIQVEAPPSVTLSSTTGPLGVTLVNGLDQPVTVALQSESDDGLTLRGRAVRQLAPGARTPVRFEATAERTGIHELRFEVTSESGEPTGSSAELPVRASSVSGLIWVVMVAGAALLFGAIAVRLVRRARRARKGPAA